MWLAVRLPKQPAMPIQHCVFFAFAADAPAVERAAILDGLAALTDSLPGLTGIRTGPNRDFEAKSQAYAHGFLFEAESADALARYASHPAHKALGARLCDAVVGGADGIIVFDLETP